MGKLFCDCKTDEEKSIFFLSGRAFETGIIAHAISNDVAMAYHRCAEMKKEIDALRAKIKQMEQQEPVATIHINSITGNSSVYFIPGHRYLHHNSSLYALPGAQPAPNFADAYQGAMEEAAIWKKRALEAEDLNRKFIAEINGPTHMGEPAQPTPSVPDGWKLVPIEPTEDMLRAMTDPFIAINGDNRKAFEIAYTAMLSAAPEAKP